MSLLASCAVDFFDLSSAFVIWTAFSAIFDKLQFVDEIENFLVIGVYSANCVSSRCTCYREAVAY